MRNSVWGLVMDCIDRRYHDDIDEEKYRRYTIDICDMIRDLAYDIEIDLIDAMAEEYDDDSAGCDKYHARKDEEE